MGRNGGHWPSPVLPNRGIRRATADDVPELTELLAQAFLHGPVADWLVPGDPDARLEVYLEYFAMYADDAVRNGEVEVNEDLTCAALWYPAGHAGWPANYSSRLHTLAGPHLPRFRQLDQAFSRAHPAGEHDYLAFLAVDPLRQGMGQGTRMLRHHHVRLDAIGRAAYLEASNTRNRDLYLRHGYVVLDEITLPDGPPVWPMRRTPAPPATPSPAGSPEGVDDDGD
ncbi:GNAT family N-acetyltransferase [Micromonospora sp. NPDC047730]|uniref:GNAT family N-acetyltransferase n=1 Tax=Micromonospora sp. NPDC047730 TaxID=3364253 RepID=UPI0037238277